MAASNNNKKLLVVILVLFLSAFIWFFTRPLTPNQIFARHFEPYIIQASPRSLIEELDEYMLGSIYYQDGNYSKALEQFDLILEKNPLHFKSKLLAGISHLALGNFDDAEAILKELANDPSHLFQDQARWYLGLMYLTDPDPENDQMSKIYFGKVESKEVLEKINQIQ